MPQLSCLDTWTQAVTTVLVILGIHCAAGWTGKILGTLARHIIKGY